MARPRSGVLCSRGESLRRERASRPKELKLYASSLYRLLNGTRRPERTMGIIRRPNRRHLIKTTMALAATGAFPARAFPHEPPSSAGALPHIDASFQAAVAAQQLPGVVAMAATENGVLYEGAFGSRRLSSGTGNDPAMTRDTVFRIASMVKLITSVAAMRLV